MKKIDNKQQLLIHLASQGDSSAFLTLFSDRLRACAISLSRGGKTFSEISEIMVPMCKNLYHTFIGKRVDNVDEWFCSNWEGLVSEQSFEIFSKQEELEEFEHRLQAVMQKEQSCFRASQKKKGKDRFREKTSRPKRVVFLSAAAAFLLVLLFGAMVFTDTRVEMSFSRNGDIKKIILPGRYFEQLIEGIGGISSDFTDSHDPKKNSDSIDTSSFMEELPAEEIEKTEQIIDK